MKRALCIALLLAACSDRTGDLPRASSDGPADAGRADASVVDTTDAAPEPGRDRIVRVATYNVHLFFDTVCDSGECNGSSFEAAPTQAEFDARAATLAASIEQLDADVLALEEVENETCLHAIDLALRARGVVYPIAILGETGAPASVDVAVLARGELIEIKKHRDQPLPLPSGGTTTFARELLEVRLGFRDRTLGFFAAHFRSKNNDDPERRLAEATAAGQILTAAGHDRPTELVVLGGDLNDVPGSDTLTALEASGELLRLASDRPLQEQGTYAYAGALQAIDHLYGAGATNDAYVAGSATVIHDSFGRFGDSDHSALRADLRAGP